MEMSDHSRELTPVMTLTQELLKYISLFLTRQKSKPPKSQIISKLRLYN